MNHPAELRRPVWEPSVSKHIPYSQHVTPTIISTKALEYLSAWRIGGRTFEGISESELARWRDELNNLLRGLPSGFGIYSHLVRRRAREYPESQYPDWFSAQHDKAYRQVFQGEPPMVNELYLTASVRMMVDSSMKLFSRMERRTRDDVLMWQRHAIDQLNDINRKLATTLRRYDAELLSIVERKGTRFSEAAEFLAFLVNGSVSPVPVLPARLCDYLPRSRPFFATHGPQGELRGTTQSRRFATVEIREYTNELAPGHLNSLLTLPFEFILTHSFSAMSRADGRAALAKQRKWLVDAADDSRSQIAELDVALDQLAAGKFVMGEHHCTMMVFGDDGDQTMRHCADAIGVLSDAGIIGQVVDRASIAAWRAQLPCNWHWRPRPAAITSECFLSFSGFHNYLFGKPAGNPWGPAVTMLKTNSGTPYFMNFHSSLDEVDETGKRRLGNTMIVGASGTGKTVLLGHCLTQARKLGYTGAVFDKDRGLQVTVEAMDGKYFVLELGVPTGWNYLQLEPNERNLAFMRRQTTQLAREGDTETSLRDQRTIAQAIDQLTQFVDRADRRLSALLGFLPNVPGQDGDLSLRERLQRWCQGHENGWLFDNPTDELDLTRHDLFGFDLTEFLEEGPVRDAALTYLIYRTEGMIDGRRFAYVFDEVQHPLKVPYFQDLAQNKSRTIRKQNGIFIFATQEPEAILANPVGKSLVQQSATTIYLPNPKASKDEYVEGFKLSPAEFELIRGLGEFSRKFVIKQGHSLVTASLDLSTCPDSLLVFSGSEDVSALAEAARKEVGPNPQDWVPVYCQKVAQLGKS
ncbi:VirB4 family type IV secretion/conjugal transfer ATPase [Pusillimonas caeni]|uniref:VirB4 family type IV secretion/conjugal transfer ATPase n=1 Tax=Pusillimonas caeni TaxID=1348472 RepID=UPI000E59ADDD|nr:VirB4 family type IV secretion/conjugal transfer ATPase [Pusillimonas caeni]TFL14074.1 VirB4 family type IV secretion/conjugal transfer ATPase [Pusillimonas caeni]